jgi:hypothetical protein
MKNLIIIIIIIAVIGGAMYIYLEHEPVSDDLLTGVMLEGASAGVGGDELSILRTLKSLTIDASIFETKVWASFRDSNHEIADQPVSRPNPFAPINPSEARVQVNSTTTATTTAQ